MSSSTALQQPPNLYTPMVYLPPEQAALHKLEAYVYIASLGVPAWDWPMSMPDEYRILSTGRISNSKVAYMFARLSTVGYCLSRVMFQVAPIGNCQTMFYIVVVFLVLASSANNVLLFIRVRAVYVCSAVNGTLVFLATSYHISSRSICETGRRSAARRFLRGDGAPRVLKVRLHQGQLCYLATIVVYIPQIFLNFTKVPGYQGLLIMTVQVIENIMTSRVHRAIILRLITDSGCNAAPCEFTTVVSTTTASSDIKALMELATKHELV